MKNKFAQLQNFSNMRKTTAARLGILAISVMSSPAYAQIAKVNTVMTGVENVLKGVSITCFTLALMFAGFKMAFQHAKWSEISNIVIGGIIVGGASAIAAWLIN
ncbi:TrbC/VirB2 family protein [Massilia pseudoviolaceinigra]|uniref:TrbC/VirB2 family protein n=1 Tax=Massilia pseudoviolaceinigra TaxID=3057165 RepID=UPI0027966208|nr:TrbC/VirB2 family protein [Massilia sp. CCM 9206]MDQ1922683.1 TrbC/VirB2 family protein [Massilia sp. CCM 9206]